MTNDNPTGWDPPETEDIELRDISLAILDVFDVYDILQKFEITQSSVFYERDGTIVWVNKAKRRAPCDCAKCKLVPNTREKPDD